MQCPYCSTETISVRFYFARMEDETGYISPESFVFECSACDRMWAIYEGDADFPLQLSLGFLPEYSWT